ncbi:MarR family winged helix-turn-helix transcriptional regulator [Streptomyces sp. BI20]|uniref:MarR family winged helix-turn-helix transcriptional regulator n=1 Tax=Streptomyces sp. BI20 TaxID=3403460 RepID=UPI003C72D9E8
MTAVTASLYEELARRLSAIGAVKRELARHLPAACPPGPAAVLTVLDRHGGAGVSRLAELLAVDISVTSRHVTHVVERGWVERVPDPADGRCRILRITPAGRDLLTELTARHTAALEHALADWSAEDVAHLTILLARLRSSFQN